VNNPCPTCRTRAAAEYLARGRRRALERAFVLAGFLIVVAGLVGVFIGAADSGAVGAHHV
jgi:hypothetical protein